MALYPIQVYAVMAYGIYFYNPLKHVIEPVVKGDYRKLVGLQDYVYTAPLNIIYIADYKAYEGKRPIESEKHLWLASIDAGHCSQNVYLYCASEGLKCVFRAGAKEKELLETLGLDSKHQL
jgi:nitroreductase